MLADKMVDQLVDTSDELKVVEKDVHLVARWVEHLAADLAGLMVGSLDNWMVGKLDKL